MSKRRVVVTGLGVVSPLGLKTSSSWAALLEGKSGVSLIEDFDTSLYTTRFAALVKGFDPIAAGIKATDVRRMDTFIQYGLAAGIEAVQDAGLMSQPEQLALDRVGCVVGSGIGGLAFIEHHHDVLAQDGPKRVSPFFIPGSIVNMTAGYLAMEYGFRGPNLAVATACTTGTHAIGLGLRSIQVGDADVMICGGSEKASTPLGIAGFCAVRALSTRNDDPTKASRPWDKERDGFVLGDGGAVLVLEEYEHAKKRGARIYAELSGFGMSADAYHITKPSGEGAVLSMQRALADAALHPSDLDYINAHGTSTPAGDLAETDAIKLAFGDHARKIAISSTKSMTGHLLGAAGAIEAVFSVLSLYHQVLPATINLDHPDPACDLDYVPHHARNTEVRACLSNSFGFGGTNGSLLFSQI